MSRAIRLNCKGSLNESLQMRMGVIGNGALNFGLSIRLKENYTTAPLLFFNGVAYFGVHKFFFVPLIFDGCC